NNDKNRFSSIGNDDNTGLGLFAKINDVRPLNVNQDITLESLFSYEFTQKDFQALNPYRNPEFIRDWNLESTQTKNNQQLFNGSLKLKKGNHYLNYTFSSFSDKTIYTGYKNLVELNTKFNGLKINLNGNWLNSTNTLNDESVLFFRPRARISQSLFNEKWTIGAYFEKERNIRDFIAVDSLNAISFDYELSKVFIENKTSDNLSFKMGVFQRKDFEVLPDNNELTPSTTSINYEFGGTWNTNKTSRLTWQMVLRNFMIEDAFLELKNANKTFIGNVDHKLQLLNKGLSLNTYYESNSGQEPKIEFQFIKVQVGEGSYIWNDYNQDSIEQINEFEISPFSDQAAYEKITVFNNEFISTNRSILNQTLKINPKQFIKNNKSFFRNVQFNSRYRIDQKRLDDGDNSLFQFVSFSGDDEGFVAFNAAFDHSLFFYRGNPNFDFQLSYRTLKNKLLQISGTDKRTNKSTYTRSRVNIKRRLDLLLETNYGFKSRSLEISSTQDFDIQFWNAIPQINFRPNSKLRFVVKYKFENNKNRLGSINETATFHDGGLDLTWRQNQTSNLQFKFNYVLIDFSGSTNSPIEFEMLQGLKDGQNILWQLNYTRRISSSIDMIINYNGRKSEGSRLVNTAGVQMRAIF
ncbi:MAG: hypothetical protein HKO66_06340, partial [Saprospiraceae bacterium]|nr:hypothetical protein [Saprospiraceae bacterium]